MLFFKQRRCEPVTQIIAEQEVSDDPKKKTLFAFDPLFNKRCRMIPDSWFQERQLELGNTKPFRVISVRDNVVWLQGIDANGSPTRFVYQVDRDEVQVA